MYGGMCMSVGMYVCSYVYVCRCVCVGLVMVVGLCVCRYVYVCRCVCM